MVSTVTVDLADVQGNILRGYRTQRVRHLVLRVADVASARRWIGATAGDDRALAPAITPAAEWVHKPETFFNLGITFAGLRALRLPASSLESFPAPFVEGMAARNVKLGDLGESAPETWIEPFRDAERVHVIASIYADAAGVARRRPARRARADRPVTRSSWSACSTGRCTTGTPSTSVTATTSPSRGSTGSTIRRCSPTLSRWRPSARCCSATRPRSKESPGGCHSPPRSATTVRSTPSASSPRTRRASRPSSTTRPTPCCAIARAEELLPLGAEAAITPNGTRRDAMREVVAAKLCGRWRDGTPLELSPAEPVTDAGRVRHRLRLRRRQ